MKNRNLDYTQQVEFTELYDELAIYFGGDPIVSVEETYYPNDGLGFLDWMRRTTKKLRMRTKAGAWVNLVGKNITTYTSI